MNLIPWVEKYRPTNFNNIVLDDINRTLFENILEKQYFPHLLFYGPPGTGKTTTIMNLINAYQSKTQNINMKSALYKSQVIHLNASDERGIDIIRNQIYQFVRSFGLFERGFKFVILDEVDYMTKNAQHALKYLIQTSTCNVRFCLICNYISKIDESLQNEFICVRFNQLPSNEIHSFIKNITKNENINIDDDCINTIQTNYQSDIRSMINFIQLNQNITDWKEYVISNVIWNQLHLKLLDYKHILVNNEKNGKNSNNCVENELCDFIHDISITYNLDKKNIINSYFNYIIRNYPNQLTPDFLLLSEKIIHLNDINVQYLIQYFITAIPPLLSE